MLNLPELSGKISMDTREWSAGFQGAGKNLDDFSGKVSGGRSATDLLGMAATGAALGGVFMLGQKVASAAWELGEMGARSLDATRNLEAFAGSASDAERFMDAVVDAAGGAINRMDATTTATRFLQMGLAETTGEMSLFVEGARRLGNQGVSTNQRIDEMTQLLKNLNVNMLDNFGLSRSVVMARTQELQATQGLTREQGMLQGIQEEITRQLGVLGEEAEGTATDIDAMKASVDNLKISAGELAAGPVTGLSRTLYLLSEAIQGNQAPMAQMNLDLALQAQAQQIAFEAGRNWVEVYEELQAQTQQNIEGQKDWAAIVEASGGSAEYASTQISYMGQSALEATSYFESSIQPIVDYASSVSHLTSVVEDFGRVSKAEAGAGFRSGAESGKRALMGIADLQSQGQLTAMWDEYVGKLEGVYQEVARLEEQGVQVTEFQLAYRIQMIDNAFQDEIKLIRDAARDQETILSGMGQGYAATAPRLQATKVTWQDLQDTAAGTYVDKWDEPRRQAEAIAAGGFAELGAHPDWEEGLAIPEDVLSGDEEGLKAWAENYAATWIDNFQLGMSAGMAEVPIASEMVGVIDTSLDQDTQSYFEAGERLWQAIERGVVAAIKTTPWKREIAAAVANEVYEIMVERGWISDNR